MAKQPKRKFDCVICGTPIIAEIGAWKCSVCDCPYVNNEPRMHETGVQHFKRIWKETGRKVKY